MSCSTPSMQSLPTACAASDAVDKYGCVTPAEFASALKNVAFDSTVRDVVALLSDGAPGGGPHPRAAAMSAWYGSLSDADRVMVLEVIREGAHAAVFGVLCVLDGARAIDESPHADLVLTASKDGELTVLASPDADVELHDCFNDEVHPPSEPWPNS